MCGARTQAGSYTGPHIPHGVMFAAVQRPNCPTSRCGWLVARRARARARGVWECGRGRALEMTVGIPTKLRKCSYVYQTCTLPRVQSNRDSHFCTRRRHATGVRHTFPTTKDAQTWKSCGRWTTLLVSRSGGSLTLGTLVRTCAHRTEFETKKDRTHNAKGAAPIERRHHAAPARKERCVLS